MGRVRVALFPLIVLALHGLGASLLGQIRADVESIGFGQQYRAETWVPMVVRVTPPPGPSVELLLQVRQRDLDGDETVYSRPITITGAPAGGATTTQRFTTYFRPTPLDNGLPDATQNDLSALRQKLSVFLADPSGQPVASVAINDGMTLVDRDAGLGDDGRGRKLILMVGQEQAPTRELTDPRPRGTAESVMTVQITNPAALPEDVRGYGGVDAVVWLDADSSALQSDGGERLAALTQFVRDGGRLLVTTPAEPARIAALLPLLPVRLGESVDAARSDALRDIALSGPAPAKLTLAAYAAAWSASGPFRIARAAALPDSIVERWTVLGDPNDPTPYLARRPLGFGAVSWVAQDLTDRRLGRVSIGWSFVWHTLLGYPPPTIASDDDSDAARIRYGGGGVRDLGTTTLAGLDVTETSVALVTIALIFFIAYWITSGPLLAIVLGRRKQSTLAWPAFAALGLAATGLTVMVVWLVLRGPPRMQQVSLVRTEARTGGTSLVQSRFGLYIPKDGVQRISTAGDDADESKSAWVAPLTAHPSQFADRLGVLAPSEYRVDVTRAGQLAVPYRSTLKKLQAVWRGAASQRIGGSVRVEADRTLSGKLLSTLPATLRDVYFVYRTLDGNDTDAVFYLPEWKSGDSVDFADLQTRRVGQGADTRRPTVGDVAKPDRGEFASGSLKNDWFRYWTDRMDTGLSGVAVNDINEAAPPSVPLLSVFDRLGAMGAPRQPGKSRIDFIRRSGRGWDCSAAISAGGLLVIATADGQPLPMPLTVNGTATPGNGRVIYQFVVPLERPAPTPPTSEPSE